MNRHSGKRNPPGTDQQDSRSNLERRRIGQIVHDDRGTASVEWHDAPLDHERQKFELEDARGSGRGDSKLRGGLRLEVRNDDTFNPYDRSPGSSAGKAGTPDGMHGGHGGKSGKRDLKKLSEWLKLMRAMEERKKNGDETE